MQRVSHATGKADLFGTSKPGYTDGSPGVEARTVLNSAAMNSVQEELARVVELAGGTLDPASFQQVFDAIGVLIHTWAGTVSQTPYLAVSTTAADDAHVANKFKAIFRFVTDAGVVRMHTGLEASEALFTITVNGGWSVANERWQKDINAQAAYALMWTGSGIRVSSVAGGTPTWTSWPTSAGTILAGRFAFAAPKTRTSYLRLGGANSGGRDGLTGAVLGQSGSFIWVDFRFPESWVGGVLDFRYQQATTGASVFRLARIAVDWSTDGPPTMTFPVSASGPATTGWHTTALDLTSYVFDPAYEYRLIWVPADNSDKLAGVRVRDWTDAGPENYL